jgi:hypothetical protein
MKIPLKLLGMGAAVCQLIACSKTVQWEEQVPLNTGEVVSVKRTGTYAYESESGNPMKSRYAPQARSSFEFTYKGKVYSHADDAELVLLAIGPDGVPNLIASAHSYEWQWRHEHYCATPSYVQFRPDSTGQKWVWPERIDPWLYNLPTNLIFGLVPVEANNKKFTAAERASSNAPVTVRFKEYRYLDPDFQHQNCKRRN